MGCSAWVWGGSFIVTQCVRAHEQEGDHLIGCQIAMRENFKWSG